jgi:hypothetical protein
MTVQRVASDVRLLSGQSASFELPEGVEGIRLSLSGGNVAGLEPGTVLGTAIVEPGGVRHELRVGDFSDWGVARSAHYLSSDNSRLWSPGGVVIDRGRNAFRTGTGRVRIPGSADTLRIEASEALGNSGRLTVESVEVERR